MIEMTLTEIADAVGGVAPGEATVDGGAFLDPRTPEPGGLFVDLAGELADGHDLARAAGEAGAVAALASRPTVLPTVVVDDVTGALGLLARHVLDRLPDTVVLATTGSRSRTGILDHLAHVLSTDGPTIAARGSSDDELGVPLTVLRATPETRYLALEMAASGGGHLARLCAIAPPHVATGEVVEALAPGGTAVLDADDDLARDLVSRTRATVTTFGGPGADVAVDEVTTDEIGRQSFELAHRGSFATVHLAQVGTCQWRDAAAAAAMALAAGLDLDAVADALSDALSDALPDAVPAGGRRLGVGERADGLVVLDDSRDADPESARAALDTLAGIGARSGRRTVAVLGEVLEPGDAAVQAHRAVGAYAAGVGVDLLVTVGPAAGAIAEGHSGVGTGRVTIPTAGRDAAAEWLRHNVSAADVVLVTASRGAALDVIADELLEEGNSNR